MSSTSVDLPDPETPVTATKQPERELDVDLLQVVLAGALDADEALRVARPARVRDRDGALAVEVLRR